MRYHERIRQLGLAVIMTGLASLAVQRTAQAAPFPPVIPSSQYSWTQIGQYPTDLGLQADGLHRYGFNFTMTNTGSTALRNIFDIIPPDPAVSFGKTNGTWDPGNKDWFDKIYDSNGNYLFTVVAKPVNIVGFWDSATPQYPMFFISSYLGVGQSTNVQLQFEFTPVVGYFSFPGNLTSVPEPPTVALAGAGLLVLGFAARSRRRKAAAAA